MKRPFFLKRYIGIIKWLIIDSVLSYKLHVFKLLTSGFLGISFQVVAVGLILLYIRGIETGQALSFYSFEIKNLVSFEVFFYFVVLVFCLFFFSAVLIYYSKMSNVKFGRVYEEHCSSRLIMKYSQRIVVLDNEIKFPADQYAIRAGHSDARNCGRTARILTGAFIPLVTFFVAGTVLVLANIKLTFFLSLVLISTFILYYRINIRGAKHSSDMEKYSHSMNTEKAVLIKKVEKGDFYSQNWIRQVFAEGNTKKYMDAYMGRVVNPEKSVFLSNILLMITILIVIVSLGSNALTSGKGWGDLLLYVVSLRYAMVNFNVLTKTVTSFNRFYPQFSRYKEFIDAIDNDAVQFDLEELNAREIKGLISPYSKDRSLLALLVKKLLRNSDEKKRGYSFTYISEKLRLHCMNIRELFDDKQFKQIPDLLTRIHLDEARILFSKSADENANDALLTRQQQLYVIIAHTLIHARGIVAIDAEILQELPKRTIDRLLVELQQRAHVIIVYEPKEIDLAGEYEDRFVVFEDSEHYAIRDKKWLVANRDVLRNMRTLPGSDLNTSRNATFVDDEEDE